MIHYGILGYDLLPRIVIIYYITYLVSNLEYLVMIHYMEYSVMFYYLQCVDFFMRCKVFAT